MSEARVPMYGSRDNVCIDTMRILDSCRDKDCFEDAKVFLTDFGQEIIEKAGSLRVKDTKVICCNISADRIQFNRGFYQVTVRFYTKITIEACICMGKIQEIEGIAVTEKKVVLFGGEGCVRTFRSSVDRDFCTGCIEPDEGNDKPNVVVDLVDPIALSIKVKERCEPCHCCCSCAGELPQKVCACINGTLSEYDRTDKQLYVTLGFFSVIRIERPSQLVVSATEYSIPEKECPICTDVDPCAVFSKMAFPVSEFSPTVVPSGNMTYRSECDCKKR